MMKKKLTEFRPYQPIIRALCNPGLQERHIDDIYALINKPREDGIEMIELSLATFKQLDIVRYKRELEDISETATKQFSNENTMKKMKEEWKPLEFTCTVP
jgi:dynein heavy chain